MLSRIPQRLELPFQPSTDGCRFALQTKSTCWQWPRPSSTQTWSQACWAQWNTTNDSLLLLCWLMLSTPAYKRREDNRLQGVCTEHSPTERELTNLKGPWENAGYLHCGVVQGFVLYHIFIQEDFEGIDPDFHWRLAPVPLFKPHGLLKDLLE